MGRKAILVTDLGIDGAFAASLAMMDPDIDVLALAATAGNVTSAQATRNVHILVEQTDPARWPRLGAAIPTEYDTDQLVLHGPGGLGGVDFPCAQLHHPHSADKLISDLVRQNPKEVTILLMGPATVLARAFDRDPDLAGLLERIIVVGGAWREPGDVSAVAEFHFFCDPLAAQQVLHCGAQVTLLPLDVTHSLIFSPRDLLQMPAPESPTSRFLRQIVPHGIHATERLYGIEGLHLQDVIGLVAFALPGAVHTKPVVVDVESRGELTRGMSVFDVRWACTRRPNVDLVTDVEVPTVRQYILRTLHGR
jgi:inosine-uridine nucleoside N-ribohydrolase